MGMSMGGYFASRAVAFDERFDGLIAYDVCFDCEEATRGVAAALTANPEAIRNPDVAWAFRNAVWTLGIKSPTEARTAFAPYTLRGVADRIRQDVLILEGTEDHFIPTNQLGDFQDSLVNARSVTTRLFDRASGGAAHCQEGALTLLHAAIFDWLLKDFPAGGEAR